MNDIAVRLKRDYGAERIWLLGSYARGTADADSDVELMIIAATEESFFDRMASVHRLLRGHRGNLAVSPIVLTPSELEQRIRTGDQFISEIVHSGVAL